MPAVRTLIPVVAAGLALAWAAPAQAAPDSVFGGAVRCSTQPDGIRFCGTTTADGQATPARTLARTWDGTAIDVNFALPPASGGQDGPYPLLMFFHGYGGSKLGLGVGGGGIGAAVNSMRPWLEAGYATFSMSDRGFGESCGTAESRASVPAEQCAEGYNHLLDTRYEVRDAQFFAGRLVDQGLVSPTRIAAIGGSYGGGMAMALAALKDRTMLPDGRLVRWRSPQGRALRLAAGAPLVPWTDLAYSLVPNGRTLDYVSHAPYGDRYGVMKESYVNTLYAAGCGTRTFCTTTDFEWNLGAWRDRLLEGEPYADPQSVRVRRWLTRFHSSYYIDHSKPPAPLLISNGWTDDLFPVDEALRYYNRTRTQFPKAPVSLFLADLGHPRAQSKTADLTRYVVAARRWLDFYVKGEGRTPFQGVRALTVTCPATAPSGGPYQARNWARLARGEVRKRVAAARTIEAGAGDDSVGAAFNPIGSTACSTAPDTTQPGTATYRLRARQAFTLLGAPTVIARFRVRGATSQVAARLLDVGPDGQERLVARGLWRPVVSEKPVRQVFQLHPGAWRFDAGHTVKLELLPDDAPYGRPSDGQRDVTVSGLQLRLPTRDRPGGLVEAPAAKVVPEGYRLSRDFRRLER